MSSSIDLCELSSSERRLVRISRCLVKFVYCSKAFLLTWEYFLSESLTLWRRLIAWKDMVSVTATRCQSE